MLKFASKKLTLKPRLQLNLKSQSHYIVFCFLFITSALFSQDPSHTFGDVQHSDIIMTNYTAEPEAAAVILAKTKNLIYQTVPEVGQVMKFFERIKIFKESAFNYGEIVIEFYHAEKLEEIEQLRAMITYPDGKMLELDERHVQISKLDHEWTQVIINFPKLSEGSIIEYEYTLRKNYISDPEDFEFQSNIPLRYASFSYKIPESIKYAFIAKGEKYIEVKEDELIMRNVPSIHADAFITVMTDYTGEIKTRIESYYDPYYGQEVINPSTERMVKNLWNDRLFGDQYNKEIFSRKIVSEAKKVLEVKGSMIEKVSALQDFVLERVTWNGEMEVMCSKPINKLFKSGKAGSTELNLMMLSLLRQLGIKVNPILVSTRSNGQAYSTFPLVSDFKYAALIAEFDGANMLLDISDKLKPPHMLNYQALNQYGLVIKENDPYWVKIIPELTTEIFLGEFKIEEQELRGTFTTKHNNYSGHFERDYTRDDDFLDHWKQAFQRRFPRAYVYDGSYENLELINEEFRQMFSLEIPDAVEYRSDTIFVMPYLHGFYDEYPFKLDSRGYEIDFAYPFSEQYIFRLEIPDGYEVLSLPEQFVVRTPDRMGALMIDPTITDNQIQIIKKIEMKKAVYSVEETGAVMLLFKEIDKRTKEKIVLVKKSD